MEKSSYSMRINKEIREEFNRFCAKKGIAAGEALTIFATHFIETGGKAPFEAYDGYTPKSKEFVRVSLRIKSDVKKEFEKKCKERGITESSVFRCYINHSITKQRMLP